jgi:hypothetical protein
MIENKPYEKSYILYFLFTAISIFFITCKKEKKGFISINIESPAVNSHFSFSDTLHVTAIVSTSNEKLDDINITLLNSSFTPVKAGPHILDVNTREYHVDIEFAITDSFLTTGSYYLQINASDNETSKSERILLSISEIPRTFLAAYVITGNSALFFNISKIDSSGVINALTVQSDYSGSAISSRFKNFYSCGKITDGLKYYELTNYQNSFSLPVPNVPPVVSFTSYTFSDELNFIAFYDGSIKAYNSAGQLSFSSAANPYIIVTHMLKTDAYIIAEIEYQTTSQKKVSAIFYPSGDERQQANVDFDIVSIHDINADEYLLMGNKNGHIVAYRYYISTNGLNFLKDFGAGILNHVLQYSNSIYFMATDSEIKRYDLNINSSFSISPLACQNITLDEINNLMYCASANSVRLIDPVSSVSTGSFTFADSVLAVHIQYNK